MRFFSIAIVLLLMATVDVQAHGAAPQELAEDAIVYVLEVLANPELQPSEKLTQAITQKREQLLKEQPGRVWSNLEIAQLIATSSLPSAAASGP